MASLKPFSKLMASTALGAAAWPANGSTIGSSFDFEGRKRVGETRTDRVKEKFINWTWTFGLDGNVGTVTASGRSLSLSYSPTPNMPAGYDALYFKQRLAAPLGLGIGSALAVPRPSQPGCTGQPPSAHSPRWRRARFTRPTTTATCSRLWAASSVCENLNPRDCAKNHIGFPYSAQQTDDPLALQAVET